MVRQSRIYLLTAFALTLLATIVNVACSNVADVDSGTSESGVTGYGYRNRHGYSHGYGYHHGYGYSAAQNIAADVSSP